MVAIKPIAAGEEICISYLEQMEDDEEDGDEDEIMAESGHGSSNTKPTTSMSQYRRDMLRDYYLFDCQCLKCTTTQ